MNLTSFTDVDAKDEHSMREFLDANAIAHETIYNTLLGVNGVAIEHYPLWAPRGIDNDWLQTHAREHQAIADTLSLALPVDLDQVSVEDESQFYDWVANHADAHRQINDALGL